ncbi:hypothetical protein BN2476_830025 [Paraburkholderia piptadeniae]|uniref:Uncharacterized protein n=1 Tax=Paraburkholderia piptadeniae TaxID=1701573 RepID=A0A1N7SSJ8_9BURK|nr:hypothetical protein [Paraburkholderia piptadeniae]SIT50454.1 hypothetical protein BN2476_830025 [Paraburkholderia piptadeniae]
MTDTSRFNKPKDRYVAALFVCVGFVFIPLSVLWYLLVAVKDSVVESCQGLRREFAGGPKATAIYAHRMVMEAFAHRRARRERERAGQMLTAGADVSNDRIEVEVDGWGKQG